MAKALNSSEVRNETQADFERFQEAIKTILRVPKEEVVRLEKAAKSNKGKTIREKT